MGTSANRTLLSCLGMLIVSEAAKGHYCDGVDPQNRKARRAAKSNKAGRNRPEEEEFHRAWRK